MSLSLPDEQVSPASDIQRQFWLLQRLQPESRAYHVPSVFRITGPLDMQALRRAFTTLVARHESLRTTFEERDGALRQRVNCGAPIAFETSLDEALPDPVQIESETGKIFDLGRGPLMRIRVWQTARNEHVLSWTFHHSIVDLASKELLALELEALYAGYLQGIEPELPTPEFTYSAFSRVEEEFRGSEKAKEATDYFCAHLAGETGPLSLPIDFPRPPLQSHRGARVEFELANSLGLKLARVALERGTKPYLVLLTVFALLLGRYSGTSRVVLGVPFTNRRRAASKGTVGCFVNTLPLSVDLSGAPTFQQLQAQIRQVMLGHHRHQEISLDQILGRVRPARDASRNPLYQVGFTFEPPMQLQLMGSRVENLCVHAGGAQLDLFLTMWPAADRWHGYFEYCADLFEPATIERLASNFQTLLEAALAPEAESSSAMILQCIDPVERETILTDFNRTDRQFERQERMHDLFLEQAERTPDAAAVRWGDKRLSYLELREYAQSLAHALRDEGVCDGDRVGIYMPRSVEMVVSVWAVMMTGAAYVPMDPEFPVQRIDYLLDDAQPRCVLGHPSLVSQWHNIRMPLRLVEFDRLSRSSQKTTSSVDPGQAAYVIFTSGSTGRPKGVAVSHRAICNSMLWMQSAFKLNAEDVLIQTTPYSFDVSTWELLWVFIAGAQLEVPDEGVHRDPSALANAIERAHVTTMHFVPSMLQVLLEQASLERCHSLRRVLCIGEALGSELVRRFHAACSIELHNLYGPTEAAVQVSWWFCRPGDETTPIPIGKPIANTRFYILDAQRCPVPIGVVGELYIGGVQVALEYVNRPDLTSAAFVADPFSSASGARMYRTGDLARWLPDGNAVFLGRADFQVKIRGIRIELGEVEAVLETHPAVAQCVVVARRVAGGSDAQLVAYVTGPAASETKFGDVLRAYAADKLPSYMLPYRFVLLERFPLNSNGKVDRKALPELAFEQTTSAFVAATNDVERWLSEQWCELLDVKDVGTNDNFFEAGGTSLMAARLMSRMQQEYSVEIPLVRLFEFPTIAQLGTFLIATTNQGTVCDGGLRNAMDRAALRRAQAKRGAMERRKT